MMGFSTGFAFAAALYFLLLIYGLLVFPVVALVRCSTETFSSPLKRAIWAAAILIFWPVGSFLYSWFHPARYLSRIMGTLLIICYLGVIGLVAYSGNWVVTEKTQELTDAIDHWNQLPSAVTPAIRAELFNRVRVLRSELLSTPWSRFRSKVTLVVLADSFDALSHDRPLVMGNFKDWMVKFDSRGKLDPMALMDYILLTKYKSHPL